MQEKIINFGIKYVLSPLVAFFLFMTRWHHVSIQNLEKEVSNNNIRIENIENDIVEIKKDQKEIREEAKAMSSNLYNIDYKLDYMYQSELRRNQKDA